MTISSPTRSWPPPAVAAAESIRLVDVLGGAAGRERQQRARLLDVHAADPRRRSDESLRGATRTYLALARTTGTPSGARRRRRLGAGFFSSALSAFLARRRGLRSAFSSLPLSAFSALSRFGSFLGFVSFRSFFRLFLAALSPESLSRLSQRRLFSPLWVSTLFGSRFRLRFLSGFGLVGFRLVFDVFLVCHQSVRVLNPGCRAIGRCGSERTRRACGRPSTPR